MPTLPVPGVTSVRIPVPVLAWVDLVHPKVPPDVLVVRIAAAVALVHHLLVPAEAATITIVVGALFVSMVTMRAMPTSTAIGKCSATIMSPPLPNALGDICARVKERTAFVRGVGSVVMTTKVVVLDLLWAVVKVVVAALARVNPPL